MGSAGREDNQGEGIKSGRDSLESTIREAPLEAVDTRMDAAERAGQGS